MYFVLAFSGKLFQKNNLEVRVLYIGIFSNGKRLDFFQNSGGKVLLNSMKCNESLGNGKVLILQA